MQAILENNIDNIKELCKAHYIKKMYAFGSAVSGDFTKESDIDLLYEMDYSDFDFNNIKENTHDPFLIYFDLKEKLEKLFNKKVDLIPNQEFKNKYFVTEMEKTKTLIYG
jgi:uncharacterized protein